MNHRVIPVLTGFRLYGVTSKSDPRSRHVVDLEKARCTCIWAQIHRGSDKPCEHMLACVEFEREQEEFQGQMPLVMARYKREAEERRQRAAQKKAA